VAFQTAFSAATVSSFRKPGSEGLAWLAGINVARPQSLPTELNMTKSPPRESPMQANEEPRPRHRNVYDYDGEYEFPTMQHWTAPDDTVGVISRCVLNGSRVSAQLDPFAQCASSKRSSIKVRKSSGRLRFYVVPHGGHRSAPRVIAALAGFVHDRQSAADYECNHNNNNE
jgi:hypothetical protein